MRLIASNRILRIKGLYYNESLLCDDNRCCQYLQLNGMSKTKELDENIAFQLLCDEIHCHYLHQSIVFKTDQTDGTRQAYIGNPRIRRAFLTSTLRP